MNNIPRIKRFADGDRIYIRAQQIWIILVALVMNFRWNQRKPFTRKPFTITYGSLAIRMGYPDKRAGYILNRPLGIVGEYCKLNNLPTLNAIVVNNETKMPGDEVVLRDGLTVRKEQADIMKENWCAIRVPTTGTFRRVWEWLN